MEQTSDQDALLQPAAADGSHGKRVYRPRSALTRQLGLADGVALLVGIIIGSGIFASPGVVVKHAGSVGLAVIAWMAAALLALLGSFVYAELGAALPSSGAELTYFTEAFGPAWGFAFTWTNFFILKTGSHAILSLIFARYLAAGLLGVDPREPTIDALPAVKVTAIASLVLLNGLNALGLTWGKWVNRVFTAAKLLVVCFLFIVAVRFAILQPSVAASHWQSPFAGSSLPGLGSGMVAALWAYDGWNDCNYVTEELIAPGKTLPRLIMIGLATVCAVFLAVNVAYLLVLPPAVVASSKAVAVDFAVTALGGWAGAAVAAAIAASVFGSLNGSILTGGRMFYAAARDGQLPRIIAKVSAAKAPVAALAAQLVWAVILVLPSNFQSLLDYFSFASWTFYGATGVALIVLRRKQPMLHRPYLCPAYPFVPAVYLTLCAFLVISTVINDLLPAALSAAFIACSYPAYRLLFAPGRPCSSIKHAAATTLADEEEEDERAVEDTDWEHPEHAGARRVELRPRGQ
eukprot:PLAT6466.2.p1 GENE.PLAT6466.2~~PLAT6466.2.p1  ORF type:complete len:519 (+),score=185.03 PLAT6466.2:45-1601(+)